MCGILGAWREEGLEPRAIEAALAALVHRGPDDEGQLCEPPVHLAMRRLAIIDLDGGRQPIRNEDGSVAVVLNGEIYNYVELRRRLRDAGHGFRTASDTEVLVHLYEEHGDQMCEHLVGMFAFALWDRRQRRLLLARDRFGQKPLYWTRGPAGGLLFASELGGLAPLVHAVEARMEIDDQAVYDYLSLGCVPQPSTIFKGVHCLPAGSRLTFGGDEPVIEKWWTPEFEPKHHLRRAEAEDEVRQRIADAVRLRLRSDVPMGIFLSGGLDSSVIAYEAARAAQTRLETFTVSVDDPILDESDVAARTARQLGLDHRILPLRMAPRELVERVPSLYGQPFADASALPSLEISRLARQHVKVVLNGDGGDEVFAGYRRYLAARAAGLLPSALSPAAAALSTLPSRLLNPGRRSAAGFGARFARGLRLSEADRYLVWTTDLLRDEHKRGVWRGSAVRSTEDWVRERLPRSGSAVDRQLAGDVAINLQSDLLVKMDIATMAFSLEARSPFLDHRVSELVHRLPVAQRLRGWRSKALLRDAYRDRLPSEIIHGRKRGFEVPLDRWLEHDLRDLTRDTLTAADSRVSQYLDGAFVGRLVDGDALPECNRPALVYALLILELWLRREPR